MKTLIKPKEGKYRTTPLIPIRNVVVYPYNEIVLTFGRRKSTLAINAALKSNKLVALFAQKKGSVDNPDIPEQIYQTGTLCVIEKTLKSDDELNVLVRGISRIKFHSLQQQEPFPVVNSTELEDEIQDSQEVEALARHLTNQFKESVNLGKPVEFMNFMKLMSGASASELTDQVAATLNIDIKKQQELLEITNVKTRLEKINDYLSRELKVLEIEKNIASKTQKKFSQSMKEAVLRERMKTIKKELGETEDGEGVEDLKQQVKELSMPEENKEKVLKEIDRLTRMSPRNPESNYIRTWVDTILDMPWGELTDDEVSLDKAEQVLEKDHYGLKEVKERILEYLAVMKLKKRKNEENDEPVALPTILCFVGPPGVGKTSIGRSIAEALQREFVKISLGGIRDEAEIRGHRRTYIGAMPGRIIAGIKQAGTQNPVFMLDEIDKVGTDFRGDPSAALLEALDPEQNDEFSDHYLDMPFDLSHTIFITTANVLDTIPPALKDRLEIIRFSGYTENEKFHIAKRHLLDKVLEKNALKEDDFSLTDATYKRIINSYTKESGVRELERQLQKVARKVAYKITNGEKDGKVNISIRNIEDYLGPEKHKKTLAGKKNPVGMATGLAWTKAGGEILFVEVETMPGKGKLQITGQLGDIMEESAKAALSYVRSNWKELGLQTDFYKKTDVHIHVPEGAVKKDGPSAGITITTALVSELTNQKTKKDIGMTGEVTLRGRVLKIGGLKEKVIAGHSAGLKKIVYPEENQKDLEEIPDEVLDDLEMHPVESVDDVLDLTLVKK